MVPDLDLMEKLKTQINDTQESIEDAVVVPDDDHSVNTPKSGGRTNTGFVPGTESQNNIFSLEWWHRL